MKRDIDAAVVAFLARGGEIERVKLGARASDFVNEDDAYAERAMRAGELQRERFCYARASGASVSESLDATWYWGRA